MTTTLIILIDHLILRPLLSASMVPATADVMAEKFGSEPREWAKSYRNVLKDWDSYWADLDVNGDASLRHWREGRWRIAKALFRLTSLPYPPQHLIGLHLDKLPRDIGRRCGEAWRSGAAEGITALAKQDVRVVILAPTLPAALINGLVDAAGLEKSIAGVYGPDELERVGLEGFEWKWLCSLVRGDPASTLLMSAGGAPIPEAVTADPPDDLSTLPAWLSATLKV